MLLLIYLQNAICKYSKQKGIFDFYLYFGRFTSRHSIFKVLNKTFDAMCSIIIITLFKFYEELMSNFRNYVVIISV